VVYFLLLCCAEWLKDPEMPYIVDDLFVELHYSHVSMKGFGWSAFKKKRTKVVHMLSNMRRRGFYVHFWP